MFDFAFSELIIILLVALVVVGPERLPKVARTAGNLWGRLQRYVQSVKTDIANDMALEEAKQLRGAVSEEITAVEQSIQQARLELEQKILDAQMGKPPEEADDRKPAAQPSNTPDRSV